MAFKGQTKFKWEKSTLLARYDQTTRDLLKWAGMDTRRSIQRTMRHRNVPAKPAFWVVRPAKTYTLKKDVFLGRARDEKRKTGALIAAVYRVPTPDKVTTWKTAENPKGALDRSIESDWDGSTKSVVVGAAKSQWLADLHDLGGSQTYSFVAAPPNQQTKFWAMDNFGKRRGENVTYGHIVWGTSTNSMMTFTRTLRPKSFMEIGYFAVQGKIMRKFKDALHKTGSSLSVQNV